MTIDYAEIRRRELIKSGIDPDDEVEGEQGICQVGVDDFRVDSKGRIWSGGEVIGGEDVSEIDNRDLDDEALRARLDESPAMRQRRQLAEQEDEEQEAEAPPAPLFCEPCPNCGKVSDLRGVHPRGGGIMRNQQRNLVAVWDCGCGQERVTDAKQIFDAGGQDFLEKADEEHEINQLIREHVPKG